LTVWSGRAQWEVVMTMPHSKKSLRLWAMIGIGAQFAALIRILGQYFWLRGAHGQGLGVVQVDPWIEAALMTAVLLAASTYSAFFKRYKLAVAIAVATFVILLIFKGYLVSSGQLPGWF